MFYFSLLFYRVYSVGFKESMKQHYYLSFSGEDKHPKLTTAPKMWFNNETFEVNTSSETAELNMTLLSVMDEDIADFYYFAEMQFVITTVLFTLGLFGNFSVILVMRRLKSAASVLTISMATLDTLALISKVVGDGMINYHRGNFGYLFCITWHLPTDVFVATANWTLVLICIERFISIYFPLSYRSIVSVRRVHLTMATVLCIFVVFFVVFRVTTQTCNESMNQFQLVSIFINTHLIIHFVIISLGPCLMTTIFTSLVIVKITFWKSKIRHVMKSNIRQKLESSLSRLMLSSAILFVILTLPGTFYFCVIWPTLDHNDLNPVLEIFLTLLIDFSHILNFVAYFTCVELFRNSFRQLFIRRSIEG
ncbi:probable G-protein coupled receptor B0563.6 isoform X1 [Biomphalaria glabrata]|uniref:Probable G-protein coupled receptor B0563.6 isoform X1 n=1 Tax=Biomphalaria glabrata TaxID=6526 RepID=A0A9W3BQJ5_BIOGL|nr:probable G-protein coupled receptor B0563.6 isoform X1 [Biomphalaria glabrata]